MTDADPKLLLDAIAERIAPHIRSLAEVRELRRRVAQQAARLEALERKYRELMPLLALDASRVGQASDPGDNAASAPVTKTPQASASSLLLRATDGGAGNSTRGGVVSSENDEGPDTTRPSHAHNLGSEIAKDQSR